MIIYWNKRKVDRVFREEWMPEIRQVEKEYGGGRDFPMRTEAYNNYTDALAQDGIISEQQRINYCIPEDLIKDWKKK